MTTRRIARLAGLVLGLAALTGCVAPPPPDSARAEVRVWLSADPASLSLIGKTDRNSEIVATQISDSLVQYDASLAELHPRVARSWEFSEDRRTLTFHLRDDVRWHDGTPVTSEDVRFTIEQVRDPLVESRTFGPELDQLVSLETPDPLTVVARYAEAGPEVLSAWRVPLIPAHLAEPGAALLTGSFAEHPVGCGPYRFVRRDPDERIVLEANPDYWDGAPRIERLVFRIYPDQRTAFQALMTGELDLMTVTSALFEEARSSPQADRFRFRVDPKLSVWPVFWNQDGSNPFFTDVRVRWAMMLALDRESFLRHVARDQARVAITPYHPAGGWADPTLQPLPYDPDRARALLDEAGWQDRDGDGVRERDGVPFRFTLTIPNSTQQLTQNIVVWQQESWREIGVAVEIERLEFQTLRRRRAEGAFQALSFNLSFTPGPGQFRALYHSDARENGYNTYGFSDEEVDRLLDEGRRTFDPAERHRIYDRLQHRLVELQPVACVFHFDSPLIYARALTGVRPSALDPYRTLDGPRTWAWDGEEP